MLLMDNWPTIKTKDGKEVMVDSLEEFFGGDA
jgi:hypothetical protein